MLSGVGIGSIHRGRQDSARRLMKRMRVDYGVGVGDPTKLALGQRRDGAHMRR